VNCPNLLDEYNGRTCGDYTTACLDFALESYAHSDALFAPRGCNGAKTAEQAAKYIRAFVARRSKP
jgi:hypothetical protein